jgi:predicted transcriptional regulator
MTEKPTEKYLPRPTVTITVTLPIDVAADLTHYADDYDQPVAFIITEALRQYVNGPRAGVLR